MIEDTWDKIPNFLKEKFGMKRYGNYIVINSVHFYIKLLKIDGFIKCGETSYRFECGGFDLVIEDKPFESKIFIYQNEAVE